MPLDLATTKLLKDSIYFERAHNLSEKNFSYNLISVSVFRNIFWTYQLDNSKVIRRKMNAWNSCKFSKKTTCEWHQLWLFHDGGCYHIETSPLICSANQWAGFYMITASIMKELSKFNVLSWSLSGSLGTSSIHYSSVFITAFGKSTFCLIFGDEL